MARTINLDQDRRSTTMAIAADSVLECVKTSAGDVFTRGLTEDHQHDLLPGESMAVKKGATLTVRIFCKRPGDVEFSAELTLTEVPAAAAASGNPA
jgi:hypothetical protein